MWIKNAGSWFSRRRLKDKLNILFFVSFFLFAVLILILYQFIIRTNLKEYAVQNNKDTLTSIGSNVQSQLGTVNTLSKQIMINSNIIEYLNAEDSDDILLNAAANVAIDEFFSVTNHISSIFVFRLDGSYVNITNGTITFNQAAFEKEALRRKIFAGAGSYRLELNGDGAFWGKKGSNTLTFYRLINDISLQTPSGILGINIDMDILENSIKGFSSENKEFCFIDREGNILFRDNWKEYRQLTIGSAGYGQTSESRIFEEAVTSYYRIPDTDLTVLSHETISLFSFVTRELLLVVLMIVIAVLIMFYLLNFVVRYYITRPVEKLASSMDEVKKGVFHRVSIRLADDEIGQLKDAYNQMLIELNRLVNELLVKEKVLRKTELDILQEQIKPHFLYNTIDMIRNLALEEEAEQVYDALNTLGDFYRKFLSKGSREVELWEEVDIVKGYLKLQKLRYGDIFEDIYEIEEGLRQIRIPKLILQPLVENSLYHGIREKGEKGEIRIRVSECIGRDRIRISVFDTGVGIAAKTIHEIMDSREFQSFGLKGTIERIRYYYDNQCEITIHSEESKYTEVLITIPKGTAHRRQFFME